MRQSRRMIRVGLVAAVAICGLLTMVVAQDERGDDAPAAESLYDQLGGAYPKTPYLASAQFDRSFAVAHAQWPK